MARSVNSIQLIGNVGADPEIRETNKGSKVANVRIATSPGWAPEKTEWHSLVFWDKLADIVEEWVRKGDRIFVDGRLQYSEWTDNNGNNRRSAEIRVEDLVLLGGRDRTQTSPQPDAPAPKPGLTSQDDDLPF